MSLVVPTTQTIADTIVAQLESSLSQTIPLLPKTFTRVIAKALAGVFVLLWKYAGFVWLQMFVATASMAETTINGKTIIPLVQWGRLVGVGDPLASTRAELLVNVVVTNQVGSLPAGSQLLFTDTGVLYETVAAVTLNASTVPATIRALSDQSGGDGSGAIGNLIAGQIVSFTNALPNVAQATTVVSQTITGADAEAPDAYRSRVLKRFQRKPQGGAYADYQQWGEAVAGILNVYPYAGNPGEVDVYVEATATLAEPDGFPTAAQIAAVFDAIQLDVSGAATLRPVNAAVNVFPITRKSLNVVVSGLQADDIDGTKLSISAGIDEYFRSREPFIVGLSVLPRADRITVAALGGVVEGIVSASGGSMTSVSLSIDSALQTAYTLGDGEKAKLGTVSYA